MKYGVTSESTIENRYSNKFMNGKYMDPIVSGNRREMIRIERNLVEINPGSLNLEPWAGSRAPKK